MSHTFNANNTLNSVPADEPQEPCQRLLLPYDDIMCNRKKFSIVLNVYKLADSDNAKFRDLSAKECLKDGLKSKSVENMRVPKARGCSATS